MEMVNAGKMAIVIALAVCMMAFVYAAIVAYRSDARTKNKEPDDISDRPDSNPDVMDSSNE